MTEGNKEFEMAVGTSTALESGMIEGENFYSSMESANETETASQSNWSGEKPPDTGQLCRSCANTSDYLIPIYEGEGLEHQLEYKIQKHLPIQVSSSDTLPLQLCYQCASTLIAWDTMISSCLEAEKKLKAMQEAAEECKNRELYEGSHMEGDTEVVDSDDEPLITSKTKLLSEKNKATPIKKKILSKAKNKTVTIKNEKTATSSKEEEDKERSEPSRKRSAKKKCRKKGKSGQNDKRDDDDGDDDDHDHGAVGHLDSIEIDEVLKLSSESVKKKKEKRCPKQTETDEEKPMDNIINNLDEKDILEILSVKEKPAQNLLICHICAKEFRKVYLLHAHIRRVHERIVVAKCEICGRDFRDTSNYTSHMKIHSDVKSYVCHHCGKCFAQIQGLKIHQRAHTLDFPHLCMVCGRRYRTKQHLDQHASAHSDERPFECEVCGKFFKTRIHLKAHSWIHSDKFRYYCSYCQKGFNNSSHMRLHIKNQHIDIAIIETNVTSAKPEDEVVGLLVTEGDPLEENAKSEQIVPIL